MPCESQLNDRGYFFSLRNVRENENCYINKKNNVLRRSDYFFIFSWVILSYSGTDLGTVNPE